MAIYLKIFPNSPLFLAIQAFFQQLGFQTSPWGVNIICIVLFTTLAWIIVTLLTPPDRKEKLQAFYEKVRPGGFWSEVAEGRGKLKSLSFHPFLGWLLSILVILFFLQGIGKLIFMHWTEGILFLLGGIIAGFFLLKLLKKIGWEVR